MICGQSLVCNCNEYVGVLCHGVALSAHHLAAALIDEMRGIIAVRACRVVVPAPYFVHPEAGTGDPSILMSESGVSMLF
jgi:hypothetical protein